MTDIKFYFRLQLRIRTLLFQATRVTFQERDQIMKWQLLLLQQAEDAILGTDLMLDLISLVLQGRLHGKAQICSVEISENIMFLMNSYSFNFTRVPEKQDHTLRAKSHKYGKQTIPIPHPSQNDPVWTTLTRESFQNPRFKVK